MKALARCQTSVASALIAEAEALRDGVRLNPTRHSPRSRSGNRLSGNWSPFGDQERRAFRDHSNPAGHPGTFGALLFLRSHSRP
jgi:hypothetical protein